jgi:hypothetical protein
MFFLCIFRKAYLFSAFYKIINLSKGAFLETLLPRNISDRMISDGSVHPTPAIRQPTSSLYPALLLLLLYLLLLLLLLLMIPLEIKPYETYNTIVIKSQHAVSRRFVNLQLRGQHTHKHMMHTTKKIPSFPHTLSSAWQAYFSMLSTDIASIILEHIRTAFNIRWFQTLIQRLSCQQIFNSCLSKQP